MRALNTTQRTSLPAGLLFFSGACALIYQTAWLRQLRLIFGASTFANAAVLGIFMAGLGAGSAVLGRRADRHPRPLAFYGRLEISIAVAAALSQVLLPLVSRFYIATGGSTTLGNAGATIVRLLLAVVVLGAPTFLMGGTLPAAARAAERDDDVRRRNLAVLYATNTLGAVAGALLSTFVLLEALGNRATLLSAAALNVAVGVAAWLLASDAPVAGERLTAAEPSAAPTFVYGAAAVSGFAFFLMELVWYRLLSPLLGGTTFMFGLVLAMALFGIGVGGAVYASGQSRRRATVGRFALTCAVEAAVMLVPFALGDRIAVVTNFIVPLSYAGFYGSVLTWTVMTFVVVFPAAAIAGYQFPLLISLLGEGGDDVGRHVGHAYAWNTGGAIIGSLAGGFGLIPLLSANGCWIAAAGVLAVLGAVALTRAYRAGERVLAGISLIALLAVVGQALADGPSAVWKQTGIGAGRSMQPKSRSETRDWINRFRRTLVWESDGRESNIALLANEDAAFMVNGKSDGSARGDAGTQVMGGLLGALFHPRPRTSLVIGLGTGSTAGWLGAVPSIERVDVVELEPVVLRIARDLTAVNHDVLSNPKVHVSIADAREVLLASKSNYDIIFSEPSNPFRAGIASLFTREFYRSVDARLARGGVFVQWLQAYDIDNATVGTIYKTMAGVFPYIETWSGETGDLLLVATREPVVFDADALRGKLALPPYRDAVHVAWRSEGLEGLLSHHYANECLAKSIATTAAAENTDDRTVIEFGFARSMGRASFDPENFLRVAQERNAFFPLRVRGRIDWERVFLQRASDPDLNVDPPRVSDAYRQHHEFAARYDNDDLASARVVMEAHDVQPVNSREMSAIGDVLAEAGREEALVAAMMLRSTRPVEADAIEARLRYRQQRFDEAATLFERALSAYRVDPWAQEGLMRRTLDDAVKLARSQPRLAPLIYRAMEQRFAAFQLDDVRRYYLFLIGQAMAPCGPHVMKALVDVEPNPMWRENVLVARQRCYARTPLADVANADLAEFREDEPFRLVK